MFSPFEFLGEGMEDVLDRNRDVFDIEEAMHFDCLAHSGTVSFHPLLAGENVLTDIWACTCF